MATTDNAGQGMPGPQLTDAPNIEALLPWLNADAQRSVMRFASASNRGASLTGPSAPVEGMLSWLQDVNRLEVYDGTQWVAVAAGTQSWTNLPLVSGYAPDGNSNGTPQYRVVNLFGESFVMMRGGIALTWPLANSGNIATALPSAARPVVRRTVNVPCSVVSSSLPALKMDANTDGTLTLVTSSGNTPPWVSLNGVLYSL